MKTHSPIQLSFTLSESEFVTGHRAYLRRSFLNFRNFAFLVVAMTLVFGQAQVLGGGMGPLEVLGLIWIGLLLLIGYVYWLLPAKLYRSRPKFSGLLKWVIDEKALALEGAASEVIEWNDISSITESDRLFLLARKGHVPLLIPSRAFKTEEALENFRMRIDSLRPGIRKA